MHLRSLPTARMAASGILPVDRRIPAGHRRSRGPLVGELSMEVVDAEPVHGAMLEAAE
jgi:hypothetical protein